MFPTGHIEPRSFAVACPDESRNQPGEFAFRSFSVGPLLQIECCNVTHSVKQAPSWKIAGAAASIASAAHKTFFSELVKSGQNPERRNRFYGSSTTIATLSPVYMREQDDISPT
jgi:hypothetical protein